MINLQELPKYRCHKEVWAIKIKNITPDIENGCCIESEDQKFFANEDYMSKHKPQIGGYFVIYEDGYKSYSPSDTFENGYARIGA